MTLDNNSRRWLVIGICLHNIICPVLRKFVEPVIDRLYISLKFSHNIGTQNHNNRLEWFGSGPRKKRLNYEGINNNKQNNRRNYRNYDYKVQNPVDLSKLFIGTVVSHYTAFDESCDSSALLGIIGNVDVPDFTPGLQACADKVKAINVLYIQLSLGLLLVNVPFSFRLY